MSPAPALIDDSEARLGRKMIFDAFVATLLSLLLFVKGRSTKPSCCPKVDPDAFRNVVSILIFQFVP